MIFLNIKSITLVFLFLPFILSSQCVDGDCINGFGKIIYKGNNSYEGYFKDGLKNGQGTLIEYTDDYKVTTKGLFLLDRIIEGNKVQNHLKLGFDVRSTITSYSSFGDNSTKNTSNTKDQEENIVNAKDIFEVIGQTEDLSFSEITITNLYKDSFILKLNSKTYKWKANETKTINLSPPGQYLMHASSTNVIPYIEETKFEGGKKYRLYYSVTTKSQ